MDSKLETRAYHGERGGERLKSERDGNWLTSASPRPNVGLALSGVGLAPFTSPLPVSAQRRVSAAIQAHSTHLLTNTCDTLAQPQPTDHTDHGRPANSHRPETTSF